MNKLITSEHFWIKAPRLLAIIVFSVGFIGKVLHPDIFLSFVYTTDLPIYFPEIIFSLFLSGEFVLTFMLILHPKNGSLFSALFLFVITVFVYWLYMNGFDDPCGFFGGLESNTIRPAKIFQNSGISLMLLSSWFIEKRRSVV